MKKLGLIVNPMAGIGGKVGLKGSDGERIRSLALSLGAVCEAPGKVIKALGHLKEHADELQIITCPGDMGANEAKAVGFEPEIIEGIAVSNVTENGAAGIGGEGSAICNTTAEDTKKAALALRDMGVDLILFAGGDGTARDICSVIETGTPVVGIPAGVKIHSGVYGASPHKAGEAASMFLFGGGKMSLKDMEVMDIDEDAFREDRVSARLYGYMTVPYERRLVQSAKAGSSMSEHATLQSIASDVVSRMEPGEYYLVGPGSTPKAITDIMNLPGTLLGVDVVKDGRIVLNDANEKQMVELLEGEACGHAHIIVTVIGGQGYIFGRGNQQFSARVIELTGKENIEIIATETKMIALGGAPLLVDTGDDAVNESLRGYRFVVTSQDRRMIYKISN